MVRLVISYVDNHVLVESSTSVRVFDDVPSALEYVKERFKDSSKK